MGYSVTEVGGPGTATPVRDWLVQSSAAETAGGEAVSRPGFTGAGWYAAPAPCTVMAALLANGHFPDPFYSTNLRDAVDPAMFQVPWWYRTTLALSAPGRTALRLDGVMHKADLWVNGSLVAGQDQVRGSFVVSTFDVTDLVRGGPNAIALLAYPGGPMSDLSVGWLDWAPSPPDNNMGVWRDVWICRSGRVKLTDLRVSAVPAQPGLDVADISVTVDLHNADGSGAAVTLDGTISGHGDAVHFSREVALGPGGSARVSFTPASAPALRLEGPAVWWPAGYGEHPLYRLEVTATAEGELSDRAATSFGVRTVDSVIAAGGGRQFRVNGRPVQLVGGGWCPDLFLRRNSRRTADEMAYAIDMGLNTVRLEGKLEHDEFFDMADRLGLMVLPGWECCTKWESHAGTGGEPWEELDYLTAGRSMASEAALLRDHPSVVGFLIGSDFAPPPRLAALYVDALNVAGWSLPVISSGASEWNNPLAAGRSELPTAATEVAGVSGMKMWPYDWVPPAYWYANRFGGAAGFSSESSSGHCIPRLESLRKMLSPAELDRLWRDFEAKQFHSGPPSPFDNLAIFSRALAARYGEITSLADYLRKSQLANYEVVRAQFEAYGGRAHADEPATGVIYWMLNSAWPSLNWQLYDYYLDPAAAYFGAKKANEPVHVQYAYDTSEVMVVNRSLEPIGAWTVRVTVRDLHGAIRGEEHHELAAVAPGQAVAIAVVKPPAAITTTYFLELVLTDARAGRLSRNIYWLSTVPDVLDWDHTFWLHTPTSSVADLTGLGMLPSATVRAVSASQGNGGETVISLALANISASEVPALGLHASVVFQGSGEPVAPVFWDDNNVALFAGQSVTLTARYRSSGPGAAGSAVIVEGFNLQEPLTVVGPSTAE